MTLKPNLIKKRLLKLVLFSLRVSTLGCPKVVDWCDEINTFKAMITKFYMENKTPTIFSVEFQLSRTSLVFFILLSILLYTVDKVHSTQTPI